MACRYTRKHLQGIISVLYRRVSANLQLTSREKCPSGLLLDHLSFREPSFWYGLIAVDVAFWASQSIWSAHETWVFEAQGHALLATTYCGLQTVIDPGTNVSPIVMPSGGVILAIMLGTGGFILSVSHRQPLR